MGVNAGAYISEITGAGLIERGTRASPRRAAPWGPGLYFDTMRF